jgi:multicomponent K+:H+ antiporter subunit A
MRLPMEVLVALVVVVGVAPQFAVGGLLKTASAAVLQGDLPVIKLAVWHGFNLPLVMSIIALGGGAFWYQSRERLFSFHDRIPFEFSSPVAFERAYDGAVARARWLMDLVDRRILREYAGLVLGTFLAIGVWAWASAGPSARSASLKGPLPLTPGDLVSLLALLVLAVGVLGATLLHRQRLLAIIFISVAGLVVSLVFVRFAAPDLALTQLSVELATILLMLLALRFLPQEVPRDLGRTPRFRVAALAAGTGLAAAALVFAMLTRPFQTISGFHIAEAKPGGGGTNVVNVILVDFRGFDTLGEVAVLAMAALGVHALVERMKLTPFVGRAEVEADRYPIMLRMMMQPLLPLALAISVYIFLRGHNLPGGGFIAGLLAAIALVLQYLAGGVAFASARLRIDFVRLLGAGLMLALVTGLVPMLLGYPFLKSAFMYVDPRIFEKFELASAAVFDLGIMMVVVGTILLVLTELGQMPERKAEAPPEPQPRQPEALEAAQ